MLKDAKKYGKIISKIEGAIFLNIFRWKVRLKNFNPSIMEKLGLKSRETFCKNYMNPALELGISI